jgi:hypothetical protein
MFRGAPVSVSPTSGDVVVDGCAGRDHGEDPRDGRDEEERDGEGECAVAADVRSNDRTDQARSCSYPG